MSSDQTPSIPTTPVTPERSGRQGESSKFVFPAPKTEPTPPRTTQKRTHTQGKEFDDSRLYIPDPETPPRNRIINDPYGKNFKIYAPPPAGESFFLGSDVDGEDEDLEDLDLGESFVLVNRTPDEIYGLAPNSHARVPVLVPRVLFLSLALAAAVATPLPGTTQEEVDALEDMEQDPESESLLSRPLPTNVPAGASYSLSESWILVESPDEFPDEFSDLLLDEIADEFSDVSLDALDEIPDISP